MNWVASINALPQLLPGALPFIAGKPFVGSELKSLQRNCVLERVIGYWWLSN